MIEILGVHGIGQQQSGPNEMQPEWEAGMKDGILRARGRHWRVPSLELVFYGDLFLEDFNESKGAGDPKSGDVATTDEDLLHFFEGVEDQLVEDGIVGTQDPAPPKGRVPRGAGRLGAFLERRFGLAGKLLFYGDLTQVRRFQRDPDLAAAVLDRVRELLVDGPRVLVGHSLGSIVAYEALCQTPGHGIQTLITLGSPLGLRSLRAALGPEASERIPRLPPGVVRWINVYDPGDPVSLAGGLAEYWTAVADATVDNGDDPHAVIRYLNKKVTGEALAGAVR